MSGLFKNIANVIPAKDLASKTHKFLLRVPQNRLSPAALYYDPSIKESGLPQGHSYDVFELSSISYELSR